jgi:hypothetical protein
VDTALPPPPITLPSAPTDSLTLMSTRPASSMSTSPRKALSGFLTNALPLTTSQSFQDHARSWQATLSASSSNPAKTTSLASPHRQPEDLASTQYLSRSCRPEPSGSALVALGPLGESIKSWGTACVHRRRNVSSLMTGSSRCDLASAVSPPRPHPEPSACQDLPNSLLRSLRKLKEATRCDSSSEPPLKVLGTPAMEAMGPRCAEAHEAPGWLQDSPLDGNCELEESAPLLTPCGTKAASFNGGAVPPSDTAPRLKSFSGTLLDSPVVRQAPLPLWPQLSHAAEAGCRLIQEDNAYLCWRRRQLRERQVRSTDVSWVPLRHCSASSPLAI